MKRFSTLAVCLLALSMSACTSAGENASTGSVTISGSMGQADASFSPIKAIIATGTADSVKIRLYAVQFSTDASCSGSFVTVMGDAEDYDDSDCVVDPEDVDLFSELGDSPTFGSNDAMEEGEYKCMKAIMCDQIVWESDDEDITEYCDGANYLDVAGEDEDGAEVATYYWSTAGEIDGDEEDRGSADEPFELSNSLDVTAGEEVTFTMDFDNGGPVAGSWGTEVDDDVAEGEDPRCDVQAPTITIVQ